MDRKYIAISTPWSLIYKEGYTYDDPEVDQEMIRLTSNYGRHIELPYITYLEVCVLYETNGSLGINSLSESHFTNSTIFDPVGERVYTRDRILKYEGSYLKRNDKLGNVDIYRTCMYPKKDDVFYHITTDAIDF